MQQSNSYYFSTNSSINIFEKR